MSVKPFIHALLGSLGILSSGAHGIDRAHIVESQRAARVLETHGRSIDQNDRIGPTIVVLFKFCSPSTISRFVVPLIPDTVDTIANGWAPSHVIHEGCEGIPSFANCDASPAIVLISSGRRDETSRSHTAPATVLLFEPVRDRVSVVFYFDTTATLYFSSLHIRKPHNLRNAAVTYHSDAPVTKVWLHANDGQHTESLPDIFRSSFSHVETITALRHNANMFS